MDPCLCRLSSGIKGGLLGSPGFYVGAGDPNSVFTTIGQALYLVSLRPTPSYDVHVESSLF